MRRTNKMKKLKTIGITTLIYLPVIIIILYFIDYDLDTMSYMIGIWAVLIFDLFYHIVKTEIKNKDEENKKNQ